MRVRRDLTAFACVTMTLSASSAALAAGPPTPLALSCTSCHVSSLTQSASIPSLARLSSAQIAEALRDYASGKREGVIMPRLAPALSEADISALSTYFGLADSEDKAP